MGSIGLNMDPADAGFSSQVPPPISAVEVETEPHERTYAMFEHLSLLVVHFIGVPVVVPLIMWLAKRDQSAYIDDHGKEALNFQISLVIYALISGVLFLCGIGIVLLIGVYVLGIIGMILAAVAAHKGRLYRYPMCLRLIG